MCKTQNCITLDPVNIRTSMTPCVLREECVGLSTTTAERYRSSNFRRDPSLKRAERHVPERTVMTCIPWMTNCILLSFASRAFFRSSVLTPRLLAMYHRKRGAIAQGRLICILNRRRSVSPIYVLHACRERPLNARANEQFYVKKKKKKKVLRKRNKIVKIREREEWGKIRDDDRLRLGGIKELPIAA